MESSERRVSGGRCSVANSPEGEGQVIPKIVVGHGVKLINERSPTGFRFKQQAVLDDLLGRKVQYF